MACLPQLGCVPAAYAVVAGGCDWPLPSAIGLSNNDVIALRPLRQFRYVLYVACVGWKPGLSNQMSANESSHGPSAWRLTIDN